MFFCNDTATSEIYTLLPLRSPDLVEFYSQLQGSPNIVRSSQFAVDAAAGALPALSMVWHDAPYDEHPPSDVTIGHNAVWQAVDAVAKAGLWDSTVFLLTWDDWGGYDDHVAT